MGCGTILEEHLRSEYINGVFEVFINCRARVDNAPRFP